MQKKTISQLKQIVRTYFCIICFFLCVALITILWASPISIKQITETDSEMDRLYRDLEFRINDPNAVLSKRLLFKIHVENRDMWFVSLSETLNSGYGVIGLYNDQFQFIELLKMSRILSMQFHTLNNGLTLLSVKTVHGAGSGYWSESFSLYNPLDMHNCLWSVIINEYCMGPVKEDCTGYQLRTLLRFLDIDCDGKEEIIVTKIKCWLPDEAFSIPDEPEVTLETYKYNETEKKFSCIEIPGQVIAVN